MQIQIDYTYVDGVLGRTLWKGTTLKVTKEEAKRILKIRKNGKYVASMCEQKQPVRTKNGIVPIFVSANTIVYIENLYKIGGTETWLLNMLKKLNCKDIILVYKTNQGTILNELENYCRIVQDKENYHYTCNRFIIGTVVSSEIFNRVIKDKAYQFIHADLSGMKKVRETWFKKSDFVDQLVSVSETARKGLKEVSNEDSIVLYNPLNNDIRPKDVKVFCTIGRGTIEKGTDRVLALVKKFKEYNKQFVWFMCGTQDLQSDPSIVEELKQYKEVIFVHPSEGNKIIMQFADWTVIPSSTESFCYTALESLQLGTPVILTAFEEAYNIVNNNFNGLIIPLEKEKYDRDLVENIFRTEQPNIKIIDRFDLKLAKEIFGIEE